MTSNKMCCMIDFIKLIIMNVQLKISILYISIGINPRKML